MRIFLAGASGVIGVRLVPLLVETGHTVAGMTRSPGKRKLVEALGAEPVVCDVFDRRGLEAAVTGFAPDLVMHQLTDLPDLAEAIPEYAGRNNRIRTEGTRNLLAAETGVFEVAEDCPRSRAGSRPSGLRHARRKPRKESPAGAAKPGA